MIGMHRRMTRSVTMLSLAALVLTGCTSEASNIGRAQDKRKEVDVADTGFTLSTVGSYDSADTAVVLSTDAKNKAVSFVNMDTGKQYTLYYDGTTYVKDKYDGPMTISQIEAGDVVDVTFLKGKKRLASIKKSPKAWVYDDVYNYDLTGANGTASIGSQTYAMQEGAVVLSEGKRVDKAEVVSQDVVTISGIDHKIYSVNVDKGHGYLSLKNEQPLLGGWIEVGNSIIRQITEDMLLVVPEGSYQVALSNNNVGCVKEVTVERDKEVVLDVSDLEIAEDAVGKILFTVEPESAKVSVDGKPVDISRAVELKYGIHQIQAEANGYDTLTKYIQVGSEYATISFKLEESRKEDKSSVSNNAIDRIPWQDTMDSVNENKQESDSLSSNTLSNINENALKSSQNGKVDVKVKDVDTDRELEKVTVRLEMEDSNKKVISTRSKESPCSFAKDENARTYRFILSKDGYETKTFEPGLESYQKDETVYFWLKKKTSSSSNEGIPSNIVAAIASAASTCILTNGQDAYIHYEENKGGYLTNAGKEKIETAITEAVTEIVGTEKIKEYKKIEVDDNLKDIKIVPETGDYQGTVSVTVGRDGYKDKEITVSVVVKNYVVTVSSNSVDKEAYKPGEEIQFTVKVENSQGFTMENPKIIWEIKGNESKATSIDTNGKLIIGSDESAQEVIVTATYKDNDTVKGSGEAKVSISKITVTITQPAGEVVKDKGVTLQAEIQQDGKPLPSDSLKWEVRAKDNEKWESIDGQWTPRESGEFEIKATYTDVVGDQKIEYSDSKFVKVSEPGKSSAQAGSSLPTPKSPADDAEASDDSSAADTKTSDDSSAADTKTSDDSSAADTKTPDDSSAADTKTPDDSSAADTETPDDSLPADSEDSTDSGTPDSKLPADSTQTDLDNDGDATDSGSEESKGAESEKKTDNDNLTEETVIIDQKAAHPIRKWLSSLFK